MNLGPRGLEPSYYSYFSSNSTIVTIAWSDCNKPRKYPMALENSVPTIGTGQLRNVIIYTIQYYKAKKLYFSQKSEPCYMLQR